MPLAVSLLQIVTTLCIAVEPDRDFSGLWKLTPDSAHASMPFAPDRLMKVHHKDARLSINGRADTMIPADWSYNTASVEPSKWMLDGARMSSVTKWEGSALLVNTIVTGVRSYSLSDRWRLSRDRNTLTIRRQMVERNGEKEWTMVYTRNGAESQAIQISAGEAVVEAPKTGWRAAEPVKAAETVVAEAPKPIEVNPGTRIPLSLLNTISTKNAAEGDRVYLETLYPITIDNHIIIPRGSHVAGTVSFVKRPGRARGKGELYLRFDSLTLPNGVTRDLRSRMGSADGQGNLDKSEGKIKGQGDKGGDARKVGEATAAGAGVGTAIGAASGHYGMGAGIGAAAGAAAGLAGVLLSRGPDIVLQKGTTLEMVLDRTLTYEEEELGRAR